GSKYLVAYYVASSKLDEELIRNELGSKLPEYMVPSSIVYLTSMPLTINGKLDKKMLPKVSFSDSSKYVAPRDELEARICEIYAEVLGLKAELVGINDNFFNLGGDSIISIQVVGKLRQKLGISISVKDIFTYKSVASLYDAVIIKVIKNEDNRKVIQESGELSGEVELLEIQRWFFRNVATGLFKEYNHWNQSFLIKVDKLDEEILRLSIVKLVEYHDALRIKYELDKDSELGYRQYYTGVDEVDLVCIDLAKVDNLENELTNLQNQFKLMGKGVLYRFAYITGYADGSSRVFVAAHHLVIDAVSWRIIADDLGVIYTKLRASRAEGSLSQVMLSGAEDLLGVKGTSYRQWVGLVKGYGEKQTQQLSYWNNQLLDLQQSDNVLDKLSCVDQFNTTNLELTRENTDKLLRTANKVYNTQINHLLLTAYTMALQNITNSNVQHICIEGHGRENIYNGAELSKTVGWFTTMYPVRIYSTMDNLEFSIINTKEILRNVLNNGIGYGALCGYTKLPRIGFNYLGQFDNNSNAASWSIVPESCGETVNSNNSTNFIISLNAFVTNGCLQINLAGKLDKSLVERLMQQINKCLLLLSEKLSNIGTLHYTMSDFKEFEPYIIIDNNKNDQLNNLFILPPGDGGHESYLNNLVPKLGENRLILFNNFLLFHNQCINDKANQHTIEHLANLYITQIKQIQPKGPYNLLGWSFGGLLSFEIGLKLIAMGDKVSKISLIDTFFDLKQYYKVMAIMPKNNHLTQYNYVPDVSNINLQETEIILFKAKKPLLDQVNSQENIFEYYALNAEYNNLDYIINKDMIKLTNIDATHLDWVKSNSLLEKIAQIVK
ncbi:MAG: condensation domain-containing protein, partial [Burkholderiales bacterium]|nr:condensation domain-containing protein [Burkholderiales bacterium]